MSALLIYNTATRRVIKYYRRGHADADWITNAMLDEWLAANGLTGTPADTILEPLEVQSEPLKSTDRKYWKVNTGGIVEVMTVPEQTQIDSEILAARIIQAQVNAESDADDQTAGGGHRLRALIEIFNKRDNYLINRIQELQAQFQEIKATTGGTSNIRAAIRSSYSPTNTRPKPDVVQEYRDEINSGNADT